MEKSLIYVVIYLIIVDSSSKQCQNGQGFTSLECCQHLCLRSSNNTKQCLHNVSLVQGISFKSIVVNTQQYVVTINNYSITIRDLLQQGDTVTISNKENVTWIRENESTFLCYSLHQSLNSCQRKIIPRNNVILLNNSHSVMLKQYSRELTTDLFVWSAHGDVEMCRLSPVLETMIVLYKIAQIVSVIALTITILLTFTLRIFNYQKEFALVFHIIMLWVSYIIGILKMYPLFPSKSYICPLLASLFQFTSMSSFLWLTIHAVILHNSFTKVYSHQNIKRFVCYGICGWGIPLIIIITTMTYRIHAADVLELLNIGRHCDEEVDKFNIIALLVYYETMAVSLIVNLSLCIHLVIYMRRVVKSVSSACTRTFKQLISVAIKLVIIMGVMWVFKIISLVGYFFVGDVRYLFVIPDFQGVFVSILFVGNVKTVRLVKRRLRKLVGISQPIDDSRFSINCTSTVEQRLSVDSTVSQLKVADECQEIATV